MSHEQIWAPWRLAYIVQPKRESTDEEPKGCFLCRYGDTPSDDASHSVLTRTSRSIALLNRFPYNNGHTLVAPLEHLGDITDLDDATLIDGTRLVQKMTALLRRTMQPDGFNIGLNLGRSAGAGLPGHLHWHIVPRWNGDTNFMPVLGEVSVIPQSLSALRDYLVESWESEPET